MEKLTMYQVDAFSDRPFRGNPAAIFILKRWLTDQTMQMIAEENNLSETAFARSNGAGWDLRWFSPQQEVDFCGHATLAAAHVLITEYSQIDHLIFTTRMGRLGVTQRENNLTLEIPRLQPEPAGELAPRLAEILEIGSLACFRNRENVFAELSDEQAVRDFVPDLSKIVQLHPFGLAITAIGQSYDFVSRYFAPGVWNPRRPGNWFYTCYSGALLGTETQKAEVVCVSMFQTRRLDKLRVGRESGNAYG
jgi:PhzF family phenazine biosynthesis protein